MKAVAWSYVWWPKLDTEITEWVSECRTCQESHLLAPVVPARKWEVPRSPWSCIHIDFPGPIRGHILVVVDALLKWVEVIPMASTTTDVLIRALRQLFATHGLLDVLVSDNGSQLTPTPFELFLVQQGIQHALMAPFLPC